MVGVTIGGGGGLKGSENENHSRKAYLVRKSDDSQAIPLSIIAQPAPARSLDGDGLIVELLHELVV
jgi:hypothetical protein